MLYHTWSIVHLTTHTICTSVVLSLLHGRFLLSQPHAHTWWLKTRRKRAFVKHACIRHLYMSLMVAEPGPTTSEKRQALLNKEQLNNDERCTSKVTNNGEVMNIKRTDCMKPLEQQLTDVLTDAIENDTSETEMMNTRNEENGDQTVMKTTDFSACDSSVKRECDDRNVSFPGLSSVSLVCLIRSM